MKKIIILIQGIVLMAITMSYGQAKLTADSTAGSNLQSAPSLQWSRNLLYGKPLYYFYDYKTGKTLPFYSAQLSNYIFLGKDEAAGLYQAKGNYITTETDPTVPTYAKGLTSFSAIKFSTDPLYLQGITGDISVPSGGGFQGATLPTVNSNPGTVGSASSTNTIQTDAKGRILSISNQPIQISASQVSGLPSSSSYIPYTGANADINLNYRNVVTSGAITAAGFGANGLSNLGQIVSSSSIYAASFILGSSIGVKSNSGYYPTIDGGSANSNLVFHLPSYVGSGIIAQTSDIPLFSNYVPYTDATSNLNLNSKTLSAGHIKTNGGASGDVQTPLLFLNSGGGPIIRLSADSILNYGIIRMSNGYYNYGLRIGTTVAPTVDRKILFRDQDITVAGLSDIPSVTNLLPYTGANSAVNIGNNTFTSAATITGGIVYSGNQVVAQGYVQAVGYMKQGNVLSAMVKADAGGILSAAVSGTDYVIPSSLNSYVPYIGANTNLNLGTNSLLAANLNLNPTATIINGSTSGNFTAYMPFRGSGYKKIIIFFSADYSGTSTYTFPTPFTVGYPPPYLGSITVTSYSNSSISFGGNNGDGSSWLVLEGF